MGLLDKLKEKFMSFEDWVLKGDYYLEKGDYLNAFECYYRALEKKNDPAIWYNLAYCLLHLSKYKEALEAINEALNSDPDNPQYLYLKGWIYYKMGNLGDAYEYLKESSNKLKNDNVYYILGKIAMGFEDYNKAIEYFSEAHKINPKNVDALAEIGKIYLLHGDMDSGAEYFTEYLKRNPNGKYKVVLDFIEKSKNEIQVYDLMEGGLKYLKMKKHVEALKYFNKIVKLIQNDEYSYYYKAVIFENFEEYNKALKEIENALDISKNNIFYSKKGDILKHLKRYDEAIVQYQNALECNNECPYTYLGLGQLYFEIGEYEKASECFDNLLECYMSNLPSEDRDLFNIYGLIGKGETSNTRRFFEESLDYINRYLSKNMDDVYWWYLKGYVLYKLRDYRGALEALYNASKIDNKNIEILNAVCVIYEKLGRIEDAINIYKQILSIEPNMEHIKDYIENLSSNKPSGNEIPSILHKKISIYYRIPMPIYCGNNILKSIKDKNPIEAYYHFNMLIKILSPIKDDIGEKISEVSDLLCYEMYRFADKLEDYEPEKTTLSRIEGLFKLLLEYGEGV
ncbi:tetratricopeptide repeat protein [Methanotorris formicicus]|uniref:Tetratricopeptide TPR_1 repeat-containing protein n=1 Tax=Methanotorris formicicus Mc-S-70 TaxID=647171 RepID=H1KZY5_9EURY|nr:tetratricopeptide repeat protein [Methanotorris formicicus]EHP85395.1 Tetratricopeptide TPR_1 repeat-containing protein [Methanotorris formicicus Mc-S-70]